MGTLYKFQERVDALIRSGKSIILQAPTGSGKTRAALFPFLDAWRNPDPAHLPRQCLYVVPLRVLANQFEAQYGETVERYTRSHGLCKVGTVSVQTGARPEDRRFEGDLVFTTVDQFLSSMLTIPYSLSKKQANLNAGAGIGSYLVFDEFHLFPVDDSGNGALATTLHVLKMLKGITPFVLMTATFSTTMLKRLCSELDAEKVTLTPEEVAEIPSQQGKQRRYCYRAQPLDADAIIRDVVEHGRRRVIAVCNTVDRTQALASTLRDAPQLAGVHIEVLHSRFYASDRTKKEDAICCEFGEDRAHHSEQPVILVATQVIEVGLNITCEVLHTEMAPAAAIVQRAGRCARFAGESGTVYVYDVPVNDEGQPQFAPYLASQSGSNDETQESPLQVCFRTQQAFAALPVEGNVLDYHGELKLVDDAHKSFDEAMLNRLSVNRQNLQDAVLAALRDQDPRVGRELIRDVDNRTVLIHADPNTSTLPNPYQYEGIGLPRNTLLAWYNKVQQQAEELGVEWVIKVAHFVEDDEKHNAPATAEGPEQRRKLYVEWVPYGPDTSKDGIRAGQDGIVLSSIVVVNPALVQYSQEIGFCLAPGATPTTNSPEADGKPKDNEKFGPICRETYAEHIAGLYRVYATRLRDRTAAVRQRLEQHHNLEAGTLDRAIRLMFAIHDLGKLDRVWQAWAHEWQKKVYELRTQTGRTVNPPFLEHKMAAHTDYDSSDKREWNASKTVRTQRPNHAAESARAGRDLVSAVAGKCDALHVAIMTAVVCHHSARLRYGHGKWHPDGPEGKYAKAAFNEAMRVVGLSDDAELLAALKASGKGIAWHTGFDAQESLSDDIVHLDMDDDVVLYLLLARILRLADQESQSNDL